MNVQTPSFRLHAKGVWFCRWGGRDHYFTKDKAGSYNLYLASLSEWAEWRQQRDILRKLPPIKAQQITIAFLAKKFLENRQNEGGIERRQFYEKHLKKFTASAGGNMAAAFKPAWLQVLKDRLIRLGYAPRTINHDIQAVKTMLQWGMDMEHVPTVNLKGVTKLPLPPIPDKSWPVVKVRQFVMGCPDENMRAWLAVCYLCALRPKEMVRIMTGQGEWIEHGVMIIPNKMRNRVRLHRHVLFSLEAFRWWRKCRKRWTRLDSFSAAVVRTQGDGPHRLRHSAGTHLMQRGILREDADAILGHYPTSVSLTYMPMQWQHLRRLMARISLKD